jgi:polysaccharide export outer membrane protein
VVRFALLSLSILALGGCASFPDDGPTSRTVTRDAHVGGDQHYDLVKLDYRVAKAVAANQPEPLSTLTPAPASYRLGLIDAGDVLAVSIFQLNAQVFGSSGSSDSSDSSDSKDKDTKSGGNQGLNLLVDDHGAIPIPYAGDIVVAGLTPGEAAAAIQKALKGRLISPQVLVSVQASPSNSVTVIGEIKSSGLVRISPNNDTLINVLARAGGVSKPNGDVVVAITRNGHTTSAPLSLVLNDPVQNVRLAPHDEVRLVYHPRKYSTFGALTKNAQTPIEDDSVSLAGAISRLGGLDSNTANPAAVMLFRFERPEVARALGLTVDPSAVRIPVVYRLDMRDPSGFFVAQNFEVQPDDIIYVPHADLAEARKFFELVTEISNVGYDVALTTLIR